MVACLLAVALCADKILFESDFSAPPEALRLIAMGDGAAVVADGVLALDLTRPTTGKLAAAELTLPLAPPLRIVWDQRLASDSPHAYWGGIELRGRRHPPAAVRLGGSGAGGGIGFPRMPRVPAPVGAWLRFEWLLTADSQRLRVTRRDDGAELVATSYSALAPLPPLRLILYSNAVPDELKEGDAYAQDRGRHEFDNLSVTRLEPPPPRPGQPYDARTTMVFNRAMRWRPTPAGPLAWCDEDLALTGAGAVSEWVAGPAVTLRADGDATIFTRPHANAVGPDRAVLRQLQFHLGQYPQALCHLAPTNAKTRLLVTLTCPYVRHGQVIARTEWTTTPLQTSIDLPAALAGWREARTYAELDFVLEIDAPEATTGEGSVRLELSLPRRDAVIAPTHVVRPAGQRVPLNALVIAAERPASVVTDLTEPPTALTEHDGLYAAELDLAAGTHRGSVIARWPDGRTVAQPVEARLSARPFVVARPGEDTYSLADGTRLPPLLGDLFAWVPWDDPTRPDRRQIRGLETWSEPRQPPLTKWRALNEAELRERIGYLHDTGARVVRLTPNTTPHESCLDAGGHITPHGLEQLQRLLTVLDDAGIRALINLFHYDYGSAATGYYPPYDAYERVGYADTAGWRDEPVVALQRGYLGELLAAIGTDPAVLGYTLFGENDDLPGRDWHNQTAEFVKARAPRHLVVFEQGGGLQRDLTPAHWDAFAGARDGGVGYRTYYSDGTFTDAYANVCARWYAQHPPAFLAESCSGGPGWHGGQTWMHPDFRTMFRDNLWASLLAPQAMSLYWSVCLIDDERTLPTLLAERIDWDGFRRARGQVSVIVPRATKAVLPALARIDDLCCRAGVTYDIVSSPDQAAAYAVTIDATADAPLPELPAELALLRLTPGNAATILTDDRSTFLAAYVRNVVEHQAGPGYGVGVQELHRQRTAERAVAWELRALPDTATLTVWDVDTKQVVREGTLGGQRQVDLGVSSHDFALLAQTR